MTSDEIGIDDLPSELRAAVIELEGWAQGELLIDQTRSTPTAPLFHYTGEAALRGILEHRELWCFSHSQQSDDTEVKFSLDIARRMIRKEAARGRPAVASILAGLDGILASNPMGETFDFYFFSLSSHRDHARQWEEYGDKSRGFAIGFAPALFQPERTELAPLANENVFVGRVIYGDAETSGRHFRCIQKLAEIVDRVQQANPHLVRGQNLQTWFDAMNKVFIAELLIWNCLTAKAEEFRDEQETRYILMGVRSAFDACRSRYSNRDYVQTPLPLIERGNITEIIVGPAAPVGTEKIVMALLESRGYPTGIPVNRSLLPNKGWGACQ